MSLAMQEKNKFLDSFQIKQNAFQWPHISPIYKHWMAATMQGVSSLVAKSLTHGCFSSGAGI